MIFVIII